MQTAGARALREDDHLDSQPSERFARSEAVSEPVPLRPRRFERVAAAQAERRTIVITGQPVAARRRRSAAQEQVMARPDRVALWAFLLGLFLVLVAAVTANAAPL
jgi:hypothetical protein